MISYRRWSLAFFSGCLLVLLAAVWDNFAPLPLGGMAAYVIINGNSMEPGFHLGDLVIVRPAQSYTVGDEVSYWDADLGRYVFHRIVGQDLERYILKGDHNPWIDSYHPTNAEVVGKLWIHLPGIGKVIQWLRTPVILAVIAGVSGAVAMVVLLVQPNKKKARKNR
jgi:signal peptidase I